jgi:hypothetical protein
MASKIKLTDHQKDSLDIVFDLLGGVGVESFIVTFDGGGDDGQVEDPDEFEPAKSAKKAEALLGDVVEGAKTSEGTRYGPNGPEPMWKHDPTLDKLIVDICYGILEGVSQGWEINEGSHGTFYFDVKKRKMRLDFKERVIEDRDFEFEL